jgi:glyoxylase-like metal-dependent hydrolase (beta-lactamase superfamily II)
MIPRGFEGAMPFERLPFDAESFLADIRMFQQDGFGAIYLIDDERKAIVETGTSHEVDRLLAAVRSFGLRPADIDAMIVSHIHLDHAGGAGFLLESMPNAKVYVHERGFKHLVDPTRLVASAMSALGPEAEYFGTMRPIPVDRLVSTHDGMTLDLGKHELVFLDSPGHAPHELTVLDRRNGCVYTGDAAGLYFPGDEILMPVAPAPAFDLEKNLQTFERLLRLEPRALLFSHYGPHTRPKEAIERMMTLYPAWSRVVREKLATAGEDHVLQEMYAMTVRGPHRYPKEFLERRIRVSILGLADYHARMEHAAPQR